MSDYVRKCPACGFENDDRSVSCFDCGVIMDEHKAGKDD